MNALVQYLDCTQGGVGRVAGEISLIADCDHEDCTECPVRTVVVEWDGGAMFLPADRVISYKEQ